MIPFGLILTLSIIGVAVYLIGLIPMDVRVLRAIQAIIILVVILRVLQSLGLVGPTHSQLL